MAAPVLYILLITHIITLTLFNEYTRLTFLPSCYNMKFLAVRPWKYRNRPNESENCCYSRHPDVTVAPSQV